MTEGLLFVLSEPGRVPDAEFHHWYDREHAPARLAVPGVHGGERYRALDHLRPTWLATYPLSLAALDSPRYRALRTRGPGEQDLVDRLDTLDRRVYRRTSTAGPAPQVGGLLLTVALSGTDEDAIEAWYDEEHLPLLHAVPGWRCTTRYRIVEGAGPSLLAVHQLDTQQVFRTEAYRAAVNTPRRTALMATVTRRERRLFGHHQTVQAAG